MSAFNEQSFESKLINLKDSQEAINSLSSWCLQNKEHHKKIVNCWLHCLKRVKIEQRLSLFYLANDVIQYSKRKHYQFVESWGTALQKATTLVRDDKVKNRILRIFKIWEERGVYDETFITDLSGLLSTSVKKKTEVSNDPADFQASILVEKIRECQRLESETDLRFKRVKENKLPLTDADQMRMSLKDRRQGTDIVTEVEYGVKQMENYVKSLENEIRDREKLITMLHQGSLFYESQRGEAKIVCNAYRNFGNKVKLLKSKLDELIPTFVESPIPSPDVNAPSPSPDSDNELELSNEYQHQHNNNNGLEFSFMNTSSFIGSSQILLDMQGGDMFGRDDKSLLTTSAATTTTSSSDYNLANEPQAIQVINTRTDSDQSVSQSVSLPPNFNVTDFIKTLMPPPVESQVKLDLSAPPPPPPPMPPLLPPPSLVTDVTVAAYQTTPCWSMNRPPPKLPGWELAPSNDDAWSHQQHNDVLETPESPPMYERSGLNPEPVEYDDRVVLPPVPDVDHRTLLPLTQLPQDVDHRPLPAIKTNSVSGNSSSNKHDIDHRNLISLTGSPTSPAGEIKTPLRPPPNFIWPGNEDCDYRSIEFSLGAHAAGDDVVESVDMDVSEEDDEDDQQSKLFDNIDSSFTGSTFLNKTGGGVGGGRDGDDTADVDSRIKTLFSDDCFDSNERNGVYDGASRFRWNNSAPYNKTHSGGGRGGRFPPFSHPPPLLPTPPTPPRLPRNMYRNYRPRMNTRGGGRW